MITPNQLVQRRSQESKYRGLDPIGMIHYELCAMVQGWVPLQDFLNLDVEHLHTMRQCHMEVNRELKDKTSKLKRRGKR
jgi:hypothetical protein